MNDATPAEADTLDGSTGRVNVERTTPAHSHAPNVRSLLFACGNDRLDHIPRLEALDPLGLFGSGSGKAIAIHPAHVP